MSAFLYVLLALLALGAAWLLTRHLRERAFRRKPWVAPALQRPQPPPPPAATCRYRLALVGDLGAAATTGPDAILELLRHWQQSAGPASALVLLGDNVYPTGIPPQQSPRRAAAEAQLRTQLALFAQSAGRVIYLSGNHDWNKGRPDGYEYLLRQEALVQELLPTAEYLPPGGTPGPVSRQLAPGLLLVVLNTQWWVQQGYRPPYPGTARPDGGAPFRELHQLLHANRHQQVVVVGHHPVYSNAIHGGKFTARQHLFPLTTVHRKAYLPLPLLGSLLPIYRKVVGAAEDMAHPRYRRLRRRLLAILQQHPNIIYAAGHDHNLQYFPYRGGHYVVSGAGSKTAFVQPGGRAGFVHEHKGFFTLDFYPGGEVWLHVHEPTAGTLAGKPVFSRCIIGPGLAASAPAGSEAVSAPLPG